jgi:cellulose synthase/poly-beta-1,6-N-acetylglucosamine synthase-like glycosyltransferase
MAVVMEWLFWIGAALFFHAFIGFPLLMALIGAVRRVGSHSNPAHRPPLSVLIVAKNEGPRVLDKIANLRDCDYPKENLEIIVCSDGSTDDTTALVQGLGDPQVKLVELQRSVGVNEAFQAGMVAVTTDLVLMTDTGGKVNREALWLLSRHFADPRVGGVNGRMVFQNPRRSAVGRGYMAYWALERHLKRLESAAGLAITVTGAIAMVRRDCFVPVPSAFSSDLLTPMSILARGKRMLFEPDALLVSPQGKDSPQEFERRVRTSTRGFSALPFTASRVPPLRHPLIWFAVISHKYMKSLAWGPMALMLVGSLWLSLTGAPFYAVALGLQAAAYALALVGFLSERLKLKTSVAALPFYFLLLQVASFVGFTRALRGHRVATWTPVE